MLLSNTIRPQSLNLLYSAKQAWVVNLSNFLCNAGTLAIQNAYLSTSSTPYKLIITFPAGSLSTYNPCSVADFILMSASVARTFGMGATCSVASDKEIQIVLGTDGMISAGMNHVVVDRC